MLLSISCEYKLVARAVCVTRRCYAEHNNLYHRPNELARNWLDTEVGACSCTKHSDPGPTQDTPTIIIMTLWQI